MVFRPWSLCFTTNILSLESSSSNSNQKTCKNSKSLNDYAKDLLTYLWWLKRVCDTMNNFIFKSFKWRIRKRKAMKMKRLRVSRRRLKNHMAALRGQGQNPDNIQESGLHPSFWASWEDCLDDCLLKPWRMWNLPCDLLLQAITNWVEGEPHSCDPYRDFMECVFRLTLNWAMPPRYPIRWEWVTCLSI